MIVWTVGMFIVVPVAMITLPYLWDMSFEKYGVPISDMFIQGGIYLLCLIWFLGAAAGFFAHLLNPLTDPEKKKCKEDEEDGR